MIATLNAADAMLTLAGLGFLGYGIQPTEGAEWGYDLQRAIPDVAADIWWTGLFPGMAIVLFVVALTLVGEGLNDTLNPTLRKRRIEAGPHPAAPGRRRRGHPTHDRRTSHYGFRPGDADADALSVRDLRVWYGTERGAVRAVDGVDFNLRPGEILGLVGESGCGKSTLGRGVLGLLPPGAKAAGEVRFRGENLVELSQKQLQSRRGPEIGLIFQEPMTRLNPLMRISQHFEETLKVHEPDITKAEAKRRALESLRGMGIPPTRYRNYPHEFSGGMRQRLMIALTLVLRPAFIVADEPTHVAGRAGRGADHPDPARPAHATSTPRCFSSPTTWASSPRRATGWR